jgi:ribonucleoside-diphosphate reductase alpha chain
LSIQRADAVSEAAVRPAEFSPVAAVPANDGQAPLPLVAAAAGETNYEECLACQ